MKKYKLHVEGTGTELILGSIPKKVFDYIQEEFGGDIDEYFEKVSDGEVPEEMCWAEDADALTDYDDIEHDDFPDEVSVSFLDENDCEVEEDYSNIDTIDEGSDGFDVEKKHFFSWYMNEDGVWEMADGEEIEFDELPKPEDVKIVRSDLKIRYGNETLSFQRVTAIRIAGEDYALGTMVDGSSDGPYVSLY